MEENNRRPAGSGGDGGRPAKKAMGQVGLAGIIKRHRFLAEYPREVLDTTPLETLLKLETTSIKLRNLEKAGDIHEKLANNRDSLEEDFSMVEGGRDNRCTVISRARFLPGLTCSAVKTWSEARETIGTKGLKPVATYDMGAVGLAGFITNKGWIELHNPGSSSLSLKMFSINNCGAVSNKELKDGGEELQDIAEIGEFKCALRAMREAMHQVMPWNLSISAIEGFFCNNNYCHKDLEGVDKKASLLTSFVDYILKENSNKWRGREPFLTTPELKGAWDNFFGARPQAMIKGKKEGPKKDGYRFRMVDNKTAMLYRDDICVNFNAGRCIKAPGTCTTKAGRPLRHVCNHRADPNNWTNMCGASHAAIFNH